VVGLQGSLLSKFISQKLFITSVTIGRKFGFEHSRRALCCRAENMNLSPNHVSLMTSSVKFDDGVIEEVDGANFTSTSFAWYEGAVEMEMLDGSTGRRMAGGPSVLCDDSLRVAFRNLLGKLELVEGGDDDDDGSSYADFKRAQGSKIYNEEKKELSRKLRRS
tara:strand:- start:93 stop:581 length:489 start_codon:yes stop_codon:yes gene_type:complete